MTLIAAIFPELRSPKNKVRSMSIRSSFKESFPKHHAEHAQTLSKFARQHLYYIYWSPCRQFSYKKSLLVTCKISRLFRKTLSADGKYSLLNRDIYRDKFRCNYLENKNVFLNFFMHFWNLIEISNIFKNKDETHSWCISEIRDAEKPG